MTFRILLVVSALFLTFVSARALDGDVAGTVTRIQGPAMAVQDALPRVLEVGAEVLVGDVLSTGKGARLEVRMSDDSILTLGERTSFVVVDYIGSGNESNAEGGAVFRLLDGTFKAASGQLAALNPDAMVVETEIATIGIRGTEVWGGKLDQGPFEVALLSGKAVRITTRGGSVDITEKGEGTKILGAEQAPTAPKAWAPGKLQQAGATVTFSN